MTTLPGLDIPHFNERLGQRPAEEILTWAWETFKPRVVASSSFQTQSVPLLHIISRVCPEMPVIFLDTGFHFLETLAFRDELRARYGLNIVVARPVIGKSQLLGKYGEGLYRRDPDLCCYVNKVEPMQRVLSGMRAWVSGVRRDQTAHRKALRVIEPQPSGLLKIHPHDQLDEGRSMGVHRETQIAIPPAVPRRLSQHRLRTLYAPGISRRGGARRTLGGHGQNRVRTAHGLGK